MSTGVVCLRLCDEDSSYAQAAKWYRKPAEQENSSAQFRLSLMYTYGKGVELDYDQAARLLIKAASNGHVEAQSRLDEAHRLNSEKQQVLPP